MCDYTDKIIIKLGLDPSKVLKKKIRGLQGVTTYTLIEALVWNETILEAAQSLGYSDNPLKQCIREDLHNIFPPQGTWDTGGGKISWHRVLLSSVGYRKCTCCKKIFLIGEFYSNKSKADGLESICKYCSLAKSKLRKEYIIERTPIWEDLDLIAKFYSNCPKGYHVDHIIPLQGKLVSGLHTLTNLQYLLASDNLAKSNYFVIE